MFPNIPRRLSPSRRGTFLQCEQLYDYRYNQHLEPVSYARPLVFGSMGHLFLQYFYSGSTPEAAEAEIMEKVHDADWDAFSLQAFETDLHALRGMAQAYASHYSKDLENYSVCGVEQHIERPPPPGHFFADHGVLDLVFVIKKNDQLWVCDHKFLSQAQEGLIRKLPMDTQVQTYIRLAQHHYQRPVTGVLYNIILKSRKRLKKNQTLGQYQEELYTDYVTDPQKFFLREWVKVTPKHFRDFDKNQRELGQRMIAAHTSNTWVRNIKHCDNYGSCPFLNLCLDGEEAMHFYREKERPNAFDEQKV